MQEPRKLLHADQCKRLEPLVPGKAGDRGATGRDNRLCLDAVLWIDRIHASGARVVIPPKCNRVVQRSHDRHL
jgi:hypothetical protein